MKTAGPADMRLHAKRRLAVVAGACVFLGSIRSAWAYLDPGTGSYVLQVIIAGLLGVGFAVKTFWRSLKAFFSRLFGRG